MNCKGHLKMILLAVKAGWVLVCQEFKGEIWAVLYLDSCGVFGAWQIDDIANDEGWGLVGGVLCGD